VAIKILEKSKIQDKMDIDRIAREIKILKKVRHPYII
jgi:5'-AMP-activated protein kinase catalytic alpha subunit